jgi:hypothetical protein
MRSRPSARILVVDPSGRVLLFRFRREFVLQLPDGEHVMADERFFLVSVDHAPTLSCNSWTDLEAEVMAEHKWWSREELRQTTATVWPENLPAMLDVAAIHLSKR